MSLNCLMSLDTAGDFVVISDGVGIVPPRSRDPSHHSSHLETGHSSEQFVVGDLNSNTTSENPDSTTRSPLQSTVGEFFRVAL